MSGDSAKWAAEKIKQKSYLTPKVYKSGKPGVSGLARLQQRAMKLCMDAHRLATREGVDPEDRRAAGALVRLLTGGFEQEDPS